jgi:predicted outer membrane protein
MGMSGMAATPGMTALMSASGTEFDRMWVSQMLTMHNAKLTELEAASIVITNPELKAAVTTALPKIRMHRDMLSKLNTGNNTGNTGTTNNNNQ